MKAIIAKLISVMKKVPAIERSGVNDKDGYEFFSEADVLLPLRPVLQRMGVLVLHSVADVQSAVDEWGVTATVRTTLRFLDAESGESLEISSAGQGRDVGDKAVAKAITAALKQGLRHAFLLTCGVEAELPGRAPSITPFVSRIRKLGVTDAEIQASVKSGDWKDVRIPKGDFGGRPIGSMATPERLRFLEGWRPGALDRDSRRLAVALVASFLQPPKENGAGNGNGNGNGHAAEGNGRSHGATPAPARRKGMEGARVTGAAPQAQANGGGDAGDGAPLPGAASGEGGGGAAVQA